MRLRDLDPIIEPVMIVNGTQHPVMMVPSGDWRLIFWCPCCGKPFSCCIFVGEDRRELAPGVSRRWKADPLPGAPDWFDVVTITPSIGYEGGHGPKKPSCRFHGNITNGEVHFPGST